ncbi:MAG TPA: hypothetical protein VJ302_07240 [Blastocatellia bacterium]|nr:hypothetical protein [Blastocatellia bacterium]
MKNRNSLALLFTILVLCSCSSNESNLSNSLASGSPSPGSPSPGGTPSEPKIEEAKVQVTQGQPLDKTTLRLTPLILLQDSESLFTTALRGDWDERDAILEKSNKEDKSAYKVRMEFEWKSVKQFQSGDKQLHFLADDQPFESGRATILQIPPLQPKGSFSALISAEIPLNYLERITMAQRVKMQLGDFELPINETALSKLREFTFQALAIREGQMAKRH